MHHRRVFFPKKKQQHPACWFTCDQSLSRPYCSLENVDLLMDYNNNDGGCQKVQFFDTMEHISKSTQYQLKELCLPQQVYDKLYVSNQVLRLHYNSQSTINLFYVLNQVLRIHDNSQSTINLIIRGCPFIT